MSSIEIKLSHLWAVEQAQQSLEFAAVACGGVELEGKSASIKSSSECIQSSNAISFSSCILRCFESSICISTTGSRRQLSIAPKWRAVLHDADKNERKGDNDEPHPPLLLERELAVGEVDVVIGRKQSNQANDIANKGFKQGFAIEPQPPPGLHRIQIPKSSVHPKQPSPTTTTPILVHPY